ncbi:MAG: hypothetical protein DBX47_06160 [Clostridiales bacterium]|nr:MAG: hypothetical protein DBX47_06160 [Clostridiales bacterium]
MSETGKISVIIPVYKSEKYIERCVRSIMGQTYKNLEIILVDDGSPDGSGEICDTLSTEDGRIKVVHQNNRGVSSARNTGLQSATGEYVQFIDSDDFIEPQMCEILISASHESNAGLVICGYKFFDGVKYFENIPACEGLFLISEFSEYVEALYKRWLFNSPCNKLYTLTAIKTVFDVNRSIGEDLLFNIYYLQNINSICIIKKAPYIYNNISDNSLTKVVRPNFYEEFTSLYMTADIEFKKIFGSEFSFPSLCEIYISDVLLSISRLVAITDRKSKKEVIDKIKKISSDCFFRENASRVNLKSKQRKIANNLLLIKPELLYYFFKLFKRIGKIY